MIPLANGEMKEMKVAEVFSLLCDLALALGERDLNKTPGCWQHKIDEKWWVALNPHDDYAEVEGGRVPPFSAYFKCNGWPAGIVNPAGGSMIGTSQSEDALCHALRKAIKQTGVNP